LIAPLINPNDVEDFNRTILEKEAFFFFTIFVAGKTAKTIAPKAQSFHQDLINLLLFRLTEEQVIENGIIKLIDFLSINDVMEVLYTNKVGKYSVLKKLFIELKERKIDLNSITIDELESLSGIGKKTSRYFMLYTFKDAGDIAILDRHVLTFLKQKGYEVPDNTPSGKQYDNIEKIFLKEFEKSGYKSLTEFDLDIWKAKGNI
jgi:thermostable 8-oxoguanine DNA glycosylase